MLPPLTKDSADNVQDTYRAAWGWLILMAPERVPGMIQSMLQDYKEVRALGTLEDADQPYRSCRAVGCLCGRTSLVRRFANSALSRTRR